MPKILSQRRTINGRVLHCQPLQWVNGCPHASRVRSARVARAFGGLFVNRGRVCDIKARRCMVYRGMRAQARAERGGGGCNLYPPHPRRRGPPRGRGGCCYRIPAIVRPLAWFFIVFDLDDTRFKPTPNRLRIVRLRRARVFVYFARFYLVCIWQKKREIVDIKYVCLFCL